MEITEYQLAEFKARLAMILGKAQSFDDLSKLGVYFTEELNRILLNKIAEQLKENE